MPGPLDIGLRNQIVAYNDAGLSNRQIAARVHVSRRTVIRILQRQAANGTLRPGRSTGRPRITTPRNDRRMMAIVRQNRQMSSSAIAAQMRVQHAIQISRQTVNRRLVASGYRARRMIKKPRLTARHCASRLQWANRYSNLTVAHWNHVIFADESRFPLYPTDGRIRVRRRAGEQLLDENIQARIQGGGGSVHVWGAFCSTSVSTLVVLDQNVTGVVYEDILRNHLVPYAQEIFQGNCRFQHDNAPAHTSRVVRQFLEENEIQVLEQPSLSPDMNPIENLWAELGRAVRNRDNPPTNLCQLQNVLVEEWDRLPRNTLETLVHSMPRRLAAVIAARGGHTRY